MAELLRCSNADWERINRELEDTIPLSVNTRPKFESSSSEGFGGSMGSEKPLASLGGAMKRYYQNGLSRHSKSGGGNVTQIPFNWFGSVAIGREQIVESPLVSGHDVESRLFNYVLHHSVEK